MALGLYDALMYANAVNYTISTREDFRNGVSVMKNIKGKTFTGNCFR